MEHEDRPLDGVMLARIEERTARLQDEVRAMRRSIESTMVTQTEFRPVANLVYGGAGLILTAVLVGLVSLVVRAS